MLFSKQNIELKSTGLFSSLFEDYISQSDTVKPFYNYHIGKQDFSEYLTKNTFDNLNRTVLVKALNQQAKLVANTSSESLTHIQLLGNKNTFTVTTGH